MQSVDRALLPPTTAVEPAAAADEAAVLDAICSRRPPKDVPLDVLRDRVLFETAYVCDARASEVCGMCVEDLDLRPDDEHARVHGKGGTVRTVLLDDRGYVTLLKLYPARSGYTSGPLFRASINGRGGPLSYGAAHSRWEKYCAAAVAGIGILQLRHAHASELSTAACPSRWCAAASGVRPPRRPRSTPARRQGRRRRDPRRPPQTRDQTPITGPGLVRVPSKAAGHDRRDSRRSHAAAHLARPAHPVGAASPCARRSQESIWRAA
jgi:integrase